MGRSPYSSDLEGTAEENEVLVAFVKAWGRYTAWVAPGEAAPEMRAGEEGRAPRHWVAFVACGPLT